MIELRTITKTLEVPLATSCFNARKPIAKGAVVSQPDLLPSDCREMPEATRAVRFDRTGNVLRATRRIEPGEAVGNFTTPSVAHDKNERLSLSIGIGPIRIERQVTTLQPFSSGEAVFVRDHDGNIFSIPTLQRSTAEPGK